MPKVKQIQKTEVPVTEEKLAARPYEEMIKLALGKKLDSKTLNMKEAVILVDSLGIDDRNAKALTEKVKAGKVVLLDYAKSNKLRELFGEESYANVRDSTESVLTASKVIRILEKEGKIKLLDQILTVGVENFKKYVGSDLYEKNVTRNLKPFASISLKKKKGKVEGSFNNGGN